MRRTQQPLRRFAGSVRGTLSQQLVNPLPSCIVASESNIAPIVNASERQLSSQAASTSGSSHLSWWPFAALPLVGVAAASTSFAEGESPEAQQDFHLLPLATRQRIFFKYEKRIRDKSTLDKVFEYFSSLEREKLKFLTPVDLLRAVVPTYPPSDSHIDRSGSLDGERTDGRPQPFWSKAQTGFFKQFDVDGDGLISYPEFLLVLTLLSIHERDVQIIFDVVDLDGNGYIDAEEFKGVMDMLQAMANVQAAKVGRSAKLSLNTRSGMLVSFFGQDGRKKLYLPQFQAFLARLHEELVKLEFAHYDHLGRGSISPVDFAHSLVATADVRHVDRLLDKVDSLPAELLRKRVSFDDFFKVHQMQRKLHTLTVALDFFQQVERPVTKAEFVKLLKKLLDVSLSGHVVDVIFEVFGDAAGALDTAAFLEVMQRREIMWARRKHFTEADSSNTLSKMLTCFRKCTSEQ